MTRTFRFRPRYRGVAWLGVGVGAVLAVTSLAALGAALLPLVTGGLSVASGLGYMMSPAWKLEVLIDDDGLEVRTAKTRKFRVAWSEVVKVVHSPSTDTCYVDGGAAERSLLVPGVGAPAPYDIADKHELCEAIVARVDPAKVSTVDTLRGK